MTTPRTPTALPWIILALAIALFAAGASLSGCAAPAITERSDLAPLTSPRPMPRPEIQP